MADDPIETYGALFERDGDRYAPTPLCRGPWDPRAMHGGAPSALFAHVCEQHDPGPAGFSGSLIVAEFASLADARGWADADPYVAAGVYASVEVRPFRLVLP